MFRRIYGTIYYCWKNKNLREDIVIINLEKYVKGGQFYEGKKEDKKNNIKPSQKDNSLKREK